MNVETKLRLTEIMKDILAQVDFEDMYCDDYDSEGHCQEIMSSHLVRDITCGASKAVLFLDGEDDYVIKIPFYGYGTRDEDEDCVAWFNGASLPGVENEVEWDYCKLESEVYNLALEYEVEGFFASTEFLCEIDNIPVYVSKKMEDPSERPSYFISELEEEDLWKRAREFSKENHVPFSSEYVEALISAYGEEEVERLVTFIYEIGLHDFHSGNWGYDKHHRIKILDYSGYSS